MLKIHLQAKEAELKEAREDKATSTAQMAALSRTKKKVKEAGKEKKAAQESKPFDMTRVVPDCVVAQMGLKPDFGQTVLTCYKPGDESNFPGAAYLHPKEADQAKRKHQEAQKGRRPDANGIAKEKTIMTEADRQHYEKMKKRAERFGVPLSVYWDGSR